MVQKYIERSGVEFMNAEEHEIFIRAGGGTDGKNR